MRHVLCLLLIAGAALAGTEELQQRHFDHAYRDAEVYARNSRTDECRASLLALRGPLLEMTSAAQGRRAARLVRALQVVGEVEPARLLREALLKQRRQEARVAAEQARQQDPEVEARGLFATARGIHLDPAMRRSMLANILALLARVPAPAPGSLLARGVAKADAGDFAGGRADIEAAAKMMPNSAQPTVALARLCRDQGDLVGAAALLQKGLNQEATAEGLQLLALELADWKAHGKGRDAEKRAREWVDRAGTAEGVEFLLTFLAKQDEEHGLLEDAFAKHVRASAAWHASPSSADVVRLGRTLAAKGRRQSVLKIVEELIPADPGTPAEQLMLAGDLYREEQNAPRAIRYYEAGAQGPERARFQPLLDALRPPPPSTAPPAPVASASPDPAAAPTGETGAPVPTPSASATSGPLVLRLTAVRGR